MSGHNAIKVSQVFFSGKSPNSTHLQNRLFNLFREKKRKKKEKNPQRRIKLPLGTVVLLWCLEERPREVAAGFMEPSWWAATGTAGRAGGGTEGLVVCKDSSGQPLGCCHGAATWSCHIPSCFLPQNLAVAGPAATRAWRHGHPMPA